MKIPANSHNQLSEEPAKRLIDVMKTSPISTATKSVQIAKKPVYTIRNNQIVAGLVGTAGLIVFALGVENWISSIPQLSSPFILIFLGLAFMALSGLFLKKLG